MLARIGAGTITTEGLVSKDGSAVAAAVEWRPTAAVGADGVSVCSVFAVAGNSRADSAGVKSGAGETAIAAGGIGETFSGPWDGGAGVGVGGD